MKLSYKLKRGDVEGFVKTRDFDSVYPQLDNPVFENKNNVSRFGNGKNREKKLKLHLESGGYKNVVIAHVGKEGWDLRATKGNQAEIHKIKVNNQRMTREEKKELVKKAKMENAIPFETVVIDGLTYHVKSNRLDGWGEVIEHRICL